MNKLFSIGWNEENIGHFSKTTHIFGIETVFK